METFQIRDVADIDRIPSTRPLRLEIYAHGAVLPLIQFNGELLIRARQCSFPDLTFIFGNLIIDGSNAQFPKLIMINGNCKIRQPDASIPELVCIEQSLSLKVPASLPKLKQVRAGLRYFAPKYLDRSQLVNISNLWWIHEQADVSLLPENISFNLVVSGNNIVIPHRYINGGVTIKGKSICFLNLERIKNISAHSFSSVILPQLRKITGDCYVSNSFFYCPNLEEIKRRFIIRGAGFFPVLQIPGGESCQITAESLSDQLLSNSADQSESDHSTGYNYLIHQYGDRLVFENLRILKRGTTLTNNPELPKLYRVLDNILLTNNQTVYPNVEYIQKLMPIHLPGITLSKQFPNLKCIEYAMFQYPYFDTPEKVKNLFVRVKPHLWISQDLFILSENDYIRFYDFFPIVELIQILKLRHSSFNSFLINEYNPRWEIQENLPMNIADLIKQHWDRVRTPVLMDIFEIKSYYIRHLCYKSTELSFLMKAINAQCVSTAQIELNYYYYDDTGQKIRITRTCTYEVHEGIRKSRDNEYRDYLYAVKYLCISGKKVYWRRVSHNYKDDPLAAIASTFRIHENVIPHIKCLKRQGDVLICEMKQEVIPEGLVRPLTKAEYFGLLEVET